jgi:hypothetical protein
MPGNGGRRRYESRAGVGRLRSVLGIDVTSFILENAIGLLQVVGSSAFGKGRSQHTTAPDRSGDVVLFAVTFAVMFVSQQVFGQFGRAHGRTNKAVASESDFQAIPTHRVTAEYACQSPKRRAKLAQEQGVLDLLGPSRHVGHQERRGDRIGLAVAQHDPTQKHALFERIPPVFHAAPSHRKANGSMPPT